MKLPPKKAREMQVLTQNEIIRFLHQAKEEGYYELFLLELGTAVLNDALGHLHGQGVGGIALVQHSHGLSQG